MTASKLAELIRHLPYSELEKFATLMRGEDALAGQTADQIMRMLVYTAQQISPEDPHTQEGKLVRKVFKRARNIAIKPQGGGFTMICSGVPGAAAMGTDLKVMFGNLIDQAIAHEALMGENNNGRR